MQFQSIEHKFPFLQRFVKNFRDYKASQQAMPAKIISKSPFKVSTLNAKFCVIPRDRIRDRISQKFCEKRRRNAPYWAICIQIAPLLFLILLILYINFCAISSSRNQNQLIPKIMENVWLQRHLSRNFYEKLININLCYNNTKYKISWNSVY